VNRNYLLKDELQYELCIRGIGSEADVQTLLKIFRTVVSESIAVDLSTCNLRLLGVENLYGSVASKIELQALVTQPSSSLSFLTSRLRSRISHLRGRLAYLTNLGLFPADIKTSPDQEL
jgi:hypothetical protein